MPEDMFQLSNRIVSDDKLFFKYKLQLAASFKPETSSTLGRTTAQVKDCPSLKGNYRETAVLLMVFIFHSRHCSEEGRRKHIVQLAKLHYEKAARLLQLLDGNCPEALTVQMERIGLTELIAESKKQDIT